MGIAEGTVDAQPGIAHRRQMGAAGDEADIETGLRQAAAEIPADAAAAHDGEADHVRPTAKSTSTPFGQPLTGSATRKPSLDS